MSIAENAATPQSDKKTIFRGTRRLLLGGYVEKPIAAVKAICLGRNSSAIRAQRDYFVKNGTRMAYMRIRAIKMPIALVQEDPRKDEFLLTSKP